ncbi:MAG: AAA family ATPase [Micavibrio aeruginosavorus]|uniref:AAA family ATPase n=1 Tax=Micavibrio aeruginosavorus TaxID=349221 RepID=A0A7T5UGQ1_9BACT|nr:MAG: AAA family ATPase [Micavibrio aeruginosavorus]
MTADSSSPLDNLRQHIQAGEPLQMFPDDDQDEKILEQMRIRFLQRLVENTPPTSKLAYKICSAIEQDHISLPGLIEVFPVKSAEDKSRQKRANRKMKEIREEIKMHRKELADLTESRKGMPKGATDGLDDAIDDHKDEIEELEGKLDTLEKTKERKPLYPATTKPDDPRVVREQDWTVMKEWLAAEIKREPLIDDDGLFRNLEKLCGYLDLKGDEKKLMGLAVCAHEDMDLGMFINHLASHKARETFDIMGRMIDMPRARISDMLELTAPLPMKGLVFPETGMDDHHEGEDSHIPSVDTMLVMLLRQPDMTIEKLTSRLIGDPVTTELDWDKDFSYLGARGEHMLAVLKGGIAAREKGVNILLWGLPDTGKTEAVKALAKKAGVHLYLVGERDDSGAEPSRQSRIRSALLAQALLADKQHAVILFDEMEDLLPSANTSIFAEPGDDKPSGASKVFLNRLLENNLTPTLWTANDPGRFHTAVRRRFRYSVEFDIPPVAVRQSLWQSISARHDFEMSAAEALALAKKYKAPPGMINTAVRNAVISGNRDSLSLSLSASAELVYGDRQTIVIRDRVPDNYDLRLLNARIEKASMNIQELSGRIKEMGHLDFKMILYGPSGTGKSGYAAYLAQALDLEPMLRNASEFLDKYQGETEKKIAAAFKEAEEGRKLFILDEGDVYVQDRTQLEHQWQISQVNEMLTRIEEHPYPVLLTTNLYDNIDPAAKRRFTFKIHCQNMTPVQARLAFGIFFGKEAPPSVAEVNYLAPADFSAVKNQIRFMDGDTMSAEQILELLKVEAKERQVKKPSGYSGSENGIGFHRRETPKPGIA